MQLKNGATSLTQSALLFALPSLCLSTKHCLHACVRRYMHVSVCVFAARPQFKRGHRKTASHGTILDIPKIIVTGTGSPGAPSKLLLIREGRHCDAQARIGCYSRMSHIPVPLTW